MDEIINFDFIRILIFKGKTYFFKKHFLNTLVQQSLLSVKKIVCLYLSFEKIKEIFH